MVKQIPLRNKKKEIIEYTLVDDDRYEELSKLKFHLFISDNKKYAICSKPKGRLHHLILEKHKDKNIIIDHIDGNGLNNTKENLRYCTISENAQNRNNNKTNHQSQYIGLNKTKYNKWKCSIRNIHLGNFNTEIEAAIQYDKAVYIIYGKFGKTNNLITYDEVKNLKIEDILPKKKERELPLNIQKVDGKYKIIKKFKNESYNSKRVLTLEEAIQELEIINKQIENIKIKDNDDFINQPIQRNENNIAIIPVKKKDEILFALVDDILWYELKQYYWNISNNVYANAHINGKSVRMHHYVTGENGFTLEHNEVIDHINNNPLDNRKENLRKCTRSQNAQNTIMNNDYVGIKYIRLNQKNEPIYRIVITNNKIKYNVQRSMTKECAIIIYNILALSFEYIKLNPITKEDYIENKNFIYNIIINEKKWLDNEKFEQIYKNLI